MVTESMSETQYLTTVIIISFRYHGYWEHEWDRESLALQQMKE